MTKRVEIIEENKKDYILSRKIEHFDFVINIKEANQEKSDSNDRNIIQYTRIYAVGISIINLSLQYACIYQSNAIPGL